MSFVLPALLLVLGFAGPRRAAAQTNQVITVGNGDVAGLVAAINTLNAANGGTIVLASNGQYTVTQPSDWWYGPNAFPAVTSRILIIGSGATINRAVNAPKFRFFYVSGGVETNQPAGTLTLTDLTLANGLAAGGNGGHGYGGGGGGAGLGGAIFNQGTLHLARVNFDNNTAQGGNGGGGFGGGYSNGAGGGGGLGGDGGSSDNGYGAAGGGFKGNGGNAGYSAVPGGGFLGNEGGGNCSAGVSGFGGNGGSSNANQNSGGGGGGFTVGQNGGNGTGNGYPFFSAGSGAIGGGNGGAGYAAWNGLCGGSGGGFGGGGAGAGLGGGGGGGVGGGGGGEGYVGGGGNGGFGGGGGGGDDYPGNGGFGGGGGGVYSGGGAGAGGFGAGNGSNANNGPAPGGGGAGMGGVVFNHLGTVILGGDALNSNAAHGSGGGQGLGGAIFNLNGQVTIANVSASGDVANSGTDVYNLSYNGGNTGPNQVPTATVSTLADSFAAPLNNQVNGSAQVQSVSNYAAIQLGGLQAGVNGVANSWTFGNSALNCSTCSVTFTVTNSGNMATIVTPRLVGSSDFSISTGAVSVDANGSASMTVNYSPTAEGAAAAYVVLTDDAFDEPQVVYLNGIGGFPTVGFNPSPVTITAVTNHSAQQALVVTNTDSADALSISAVNLASASGYFTQTNNCANVVLAPGGTCSVNLTFSPTSVGGPFTGTVSLSDNAQNVTQTVELSGTSTKADQSITITTAPPATAAYNSSFSVAASSNSGLGVSISGAGACSGTGTGSAQLTMTAGTGACTVSFTQAGDANYNPAPSLAPTVNASKAIVPVVLSSLTQTFNATAVSPVAATTPAGLNIQWTNAPETNAGVYSVTATINDANYQGSATGTFAIKKANATITVTPYSITYDAVAHTAAGGVTGVGGVPLAGLNLAGTTHTNAGSYGSDVWSFSDSTGNYNNATGSVSDTIAKANPNVTVTPYNVTYDAAAHTASGAATGVGGVSLAGLSLAGTTHTNAGSYGSDAWTFTDSTGNYNNATGSVSDTIAKANAMVTVTPYNVIYDAMAHTATGTVTGVGGAALTGLDLSGTTHTSAGAYPSDAWAFTDAAGNYNPATGTVSDTIGKANATVTVTPYSLTYDGTAHTATGTVTGVGGAVLAGLDLSASTHTAAGSYTTDAWTFADATGNYNAATGTVSDTIAKATPTVTVTPYSVTFDGASHTASGTVTGVGGSVLTGLNLSGTAHTAAGSYPSDGWTFTDTSGNYNNANDSVSDTISKANATVTVTPYSVTYDGTAHTASGTVTGAGGAALTGLDLSATTHTNAGSYGTDGWIFTDSTGNYNNSTGSVSDSIAKANATVTVTPYSVTYDAAAHTATGSVTGVAGITLTGLSLSATTHTNAGSYSADNWTFTDSTGNYNSSTGTVSDTINKANAIVTVTPYNVTYDGNPHSASGTVTGVGGVSLTGLDLSGTVHTTAGDYPSDGWVFTDAAGNYNTASATVHDAIAKANPTVSWLAPASITYGTGLSGTQLDATANVPGTFTYTPNAGTVLPIGSSPLAVTFVPTDTVDYNNAAAQVSITITVTYNSLGTQIQADAAALSGNSGALLTKVSNALASVAKGNTTAAAGQLGAFINQVNSMVNSGRVPAAIAQQLIAQAQYLLDSL
ncbi:MAG TPA: MBG domain-containing protein [Terriglobales bacterium]|nr:MBG domain-containing protein [Terriglobales bacterium]